jgi:Icc-related predicted phosphoesterase
MLKHYDVGVLCGDLMTFPSEDDLRRARQKLESEGTEVRASDEATDPEVVQRALQNKQNEYKRLLRRSGKPIVFVMGNDDGLLGNGSAWSTEKGIVDINQSRARLGKYSFVESERRSDSSYAFPFRVCRVSPE